MRCDAMRCDAMRRDAQLAYQDTLGPTDPTACRPAQDKDGGEGQGDLHIDADQGGRSVGQPQHVLAKEMLKEIRLSRGSAI